MWYLVDVNLDVVPEVKLFLAWKAATGHAPARQIIQECAQSEFYIAHALSHPAHMVE